MEEKEIDYINVIPFVDIMLVLLTIVLTTSTFIAIGGIPVNLPKASRNTQETLKVKTIEVNRKCSVYLDGKAVTVPVLRNAIQSLDRNTSFLIRADREIPLQAFVDVLDTVRKCGFQKVSLQTETRK